MKANVFDSDLAGLYRSVAHDNNHKGYQIKYHNVGQKSCWDFVDRFLVELIATYFYIKVNLRYASKMDKGRPMATTTTQNKL